MTFIVMFFVFSLWFNNSKIYYHGSTIEKGNLLLKQIAFFTVRAEGLEPPCLAASDPKSDMSTNFTTPGFKIGLQR